MHELVDENLKKVIDLIKNSISVRSSTVSMNEILRF